MIIKILGAESLGVRGLSCSVELNNRKIFIDPGIALGWSRYGFLPHPFQIAIGAGIREKIIEELKNASDVIFSHFDGDHCPLYNPNPYQLGLHEVKNSLSECRIWAKGPNNCPPTQQRRRKELAEIIKKNLQNAEGMKEGPLEFSFPVPHGRQGREKNTVMMSKIEEKGVTFVHASDIQLLDEKTIEKILDWKPNIVLASGPPLYHYFSSSFQMQRESAWKNAMELSRHVDTLIIDHHLLRSEEGIEWLEKLEHTAKSEAPRPQGGASVAKPGETAPKPPGFALRASAFVQLRRDKTPRSPHAIHPRASAPGILAKASEVFCAADFMTREPIFLEAWRKELYEWLPVSKDWHEDYKQGKVDVNHYRIRGWEFLISNRKIKPCKWYYSCPIKEYTEKEKLERYWIENYCLVGNNNCFRYRMEEKGKYHPDNMLPDGEIREDLR